MKTIFFILMVNYQTGVVSAINVSDKGDCLDIATQLNENYDVHDPITVACYERKGIDSIKVVEDEQP